MIGGERECTYSEDYISDALRYRDNLLKYSFQYYKNLDIVQVLLLLPHISSEIRRLFLLYSSFKPKPRSYIRIPYFLTLYLLIPSSSLNNVRRSQYH